MMSTLKVTHQRRHPGTESEVTQQGMIKYPGMKSDVHIQSDSSGILTQQGYRNETLINEVRTNCVKQS